MRKNGYLSLSFECMAVYKFAEYFKKLLVLWLNSFLQTIGIVSRTFSPMLNVIYCNSCWLNGKQFGRWCRGWKEIVQ